MSPFFIPVKEPRKNDFQTISIRIPKELYKQLKSLAGATNRSCNEVVRLLLENALEQLDPAASLQP